MTFIGKVDDRLAMVAGLIPRGALPIDQVNVLVKVLLDIEAALRCDQVDQARHALERLIFRLADGVRSPQPGDHGQREHGQGGTARERKPGDVDPADGR